MTIVPALRRDVVEQAVQRCDLSPPRVIRALQARDEPAPAAANRRESSRTPSSTSRSYLLCTGLVGLALVATALCLMGPAPLLLPPYWLRSFALQAQGLPALAALTVTGLFFATRFRKHRQLVSRLSESEARYRMLAEGSSDVVLLVDGDGICRNISPSVRTLIDYSPELILDRAVCDYVHPEDIAAVREAARLARSEPGSGPSLVHRMRHRSGRWIWCETHIRARTNAPEEFVCAIRDISEQRAREAILVHRASIDSLTGLLNRDSLKRSLDTAIGAACVDQQSLALIVFDIDHFKRINDAHGHPTGDRVLQAIGEACAQAVRISDQAGRIGGEEFALVLPGATIAAATDVCMRLRQSIESAPVPDVHGNPIRVTISAGIAVLSAGMVENDFIDAADRALYAAKNAGRDCAFASIGEQFIRAL